MARSRGFARFFFRGLFGVGNEHSGVPPAGGKVGLGNLGAAGALGGVGGLGGGGGGEGGEAGDEEGRLGGGGGHGGAATGEQALIVDVDGAGGPPGLGNLLDDAAAGGELLGGGVLDLVVVDAEEAVEGLGGVPDDGSQDVLAEDGGAVERADGAVAAGGDEDADV